MVYGSRGIACWCNDRYGMHASCVHHHHDLAVAIREASSWLAPGWRIHSSVRVSTASPFSGLPRPTRCTMGT